MLIGNGCIYIIIVSRNLHIPLCHRKDVWSGSVTCNVLDINLLFIKFLCAISQDHLLLLDYIISNETCFVDFLTCYLDYIHENWSVFTRSHHRLHGIVKITDTAAAHCVDEIEMPFSLSRKRRHSRAQFAHTSVVSHSVQLECNHDTNPTKSLVAYDFSDSSEDDSADQSMLQNTMGCIIRLRLSLERILAKQIIANSQAPAKLVSMIDRVETLYEKL